MYTALFVLGPPFLDWEHRSRYYSELTGVGEYRSVVSELMRANPEIEGYDSVIHFYIDERAVKERKLASIETST